MFNDRRKNETRRNGNLNRKLAEFGEPEERSGKKQSKRRHGERRKTLNNNDPNWYLQVNYTEH